MQVIGFAYTAAFALELLMRVFVHGLGGSADLSGNGKLLDLGLSTQPWLKTTDHQSPIDHQVGSNGLKLNGLMMFDAHIAEFVGPLVR